MGTEAVNFDQEITSKFCDVSSTVDNLFVQKMDQPCLLDTLAELASNKVPIQQQIIKEERVTICLAEDVVRVKSENTRPRALSEPWCSDSTWNSAIHHAASTARATASSYLNNNILLPNMLEKYANTYNKNGRIGIYTPEERTVIISKFREKRKRRIWKKKIRYHCRKNLADRRERVKGRFVKLIRNEALPKGSNSNGENSPQNSSAIMDDMNHSYFKSDIRNSISIKKESNVLPSMGLSPSSPMSLNFLDAELSLHYNSDRFKALLEASVNIMESSDHGHSNQPMEIDNSNNSSNNNRNGSSVSNGLKMKKETTKIIPTHNKKYNLRGYNPSKSSYSRITSTSTLNPVIEVIEEEDSLQHQLPPQVEVANNGYLDLLNATRDLAVDPQEDLEGEGEGEVVEEEVEVEVEELEAGGKDSFNERTALNGLYLLGNAIDRVTESSDIKRLRRHSIAY